MTRREQGTWDDEVRAAVAAAQEQVARVRAGRDAAPAWAALAELASDERGPVRVGVLDALVTLGESEGGPDELLTRARAWLEHEEREPRLSIAALMLEALADRRVLARVGDTEALLDYLERVIADVADAPRSAERWPGRRRALRSLPVAIAAAVASLRAGDRGLQWLVARCGEATHPDLREACSRAIVLLAHERSLKGSVVDIARAALEASAKPLRDPTRLRPGTGRGRRTRPQR